MTRDEEPRLRGLLAFRPRLSHCAALWVLLGLCFAFPLAQKLPYYDTWWHLRTGELIVSTQSVPSVDPFSFTMAGKPWVAHEWLSEVVLWLTYKSWGFGGLAVLRAMIVLATFALVFFAARRRSGGLAAPTAAVAIAALLGMTHGSLKGAMGWLDRPQLFGHLFLAALIWLIQRHRDGRSLWPAVPLFALWINCHGSWLIGLIVLLAYGAEVGYDAVTGLRTDRLRRVAGVLPFIAAAVFVNPRPLAYLTYPFQYLGHTHHTDYIVEWQSPDFHQPVFLVFAVVLVGLPMLVYVVRRNVHPVEFSLVLCVLGGSLFSLRHIAAFGLVSAPFLAGQLARLLEERAPHSVLRALLSLPRFLSWLIIALLPAAVAAYVTARSPVGCVDLTGFPTLSLDRLAAGDKGQRLLTPYNWGGYAIFRLWPKYKVYVDGRADVYGKAVLDRLDVLNNLRPGWRNELRKAQPDVIVWPADAPLSQVLDLTGEWRRVALSPDDEAAAMFVPVRRSAASGH